MESRRARTRLRPGLGAALVGIVLFGFLLRLVVLVTGQDGIATHVHPGYDESVYLGAAWLVRSGSLPYRDFVFVFPPGFLVLLLPISETASWFGGPALTVTWVRVLAAVAGAVNIWLIGRVGSRWVGPVGGIVAALLYATMPFVVHTEASALQEPFVNLGVLLAVVVWSGRDDGTITSRRLVGAGLLLGVAISMKLVAGVVLVPFLLTGPYTRPVADRLRLALAACAPVAATSAIFAVLVGWRPLFEQAFEAQIFRGRDGEGLSRVNSLLPFLRGQVGATTFVGPSAWIAVSIFGAMCAGAIWKGGRAGRLWGATGATILVSLMASPSYYRHYGVLLAPALVLVTAWALTAAFHSAQQRRSVSALVCTTLLVLIVGAIGATQTVTAVADLPVNLGDLGVHLGRVIRNDGPPIAGRVSDAIERVPRDRCIVAVRPQLLLDVDRVPSADRDGQVLLDVYGSALLAARRSDRSPSEMPGAFAFASVQADIVRRSRDCRGFVFATRTCKKGRKDISRATQAKIEAGSRLLTQAGCYQFRVALHP